MPGLLCSVTPRQDVQEAETNDVSASNYKLHIIPVRCYLQLYSCLNQDLTA